MVVIWMHRLGDMYINVQNAYIGVLSALRRYRRCVLWTNIYNPYIYNPYIYNPRTPNMPLIGVYNCTSYPTIKHIISLTTKVQKYAYKVRLFPSRT